MYEDGDSFRHHVDLKRYGINPTAAISAGPTRASTFATSISTTAAPPTAACRPTATSRSAASPAPSSAIRTISFAKANVEYRHLAIEHDFGDGLTLRNRTMFGDYREILPEHLREQLQCRGDATLRGVTLGAYNNRNDRQNLFSQTDLIWENRLAGIDQTLLFGFEVGRAEVAQFARRPATTCPIGGNDGPARATRRSMPTSIFAPDRRATPTTGSRRPSPRPTSRTRSAPADWLEIVAGLRFDSFKVDVDDLRAGRRRQVRPPRQSVVAAARPDPQADRQSVVLRQLQPLLPAAVGRPVQRPHRRHRRR